MSGMPSDKGFLHIQLAQVTAAVVQRYATILKLVDETSAQHGQKATCPSEGYMMLEELSS